MDEVIRLILEIGGGVLIAVPLIIALVYWVKKAIQEKNWKQLFDLVVAALVTAHKEFETQAEAEEFIKAMIRTTATEIGYDISDEDIGKLVDAIMAIISVVAVKEPVAIPAAYAVIEEEK